MPLSFCNSKSENLCKIISVKSEEFSMNLSWNSQACKNPHPAPISLFIAYLHSFPLSACSPFTSDEIWLTSESLRHASFVSCRRHGHLENTSFYYLLHLSMRGVFPSLKNRQAPLYFWTDV